MCLHQTANKTHPHTSSSSCDKLSSRWAWIIHSDTPKGRAIKITWGREEADQISLPFLSSRCTVALSCTIKAVCLSFLHPFYTLTNDMISSRSKYLSPHVGKCSHYHISEWWKSRSNILKAPYKENKMFLDTCGRIVFGLLIRGRWCSWEWDVFILEIIWLVKSLASGHTWCKRHNTPILI